MIILSHIESNCSENISDRDEFTATEQRKNDCATEQQIGNSIDGRSRVKKLSEEAKKLESSFKRQQCEALADEEQHKWKLRDEFISYSNKYFHKFFQDKKLKASFHKYYQVKEAR